METRRPRTLPPARIRSLFLLEVASELMWMNEWPHRELRMTLREQGGQDWGPTFSGSDVPEVIAELAAGTVHVGFLNPAAVLTLALAGKGPFAEPVPVRAITVLQSYDQLVLAVAEGTGLTSLADVKRQRYPLRVSLRAQRNHAVHLVADEVLAAAGFSLDDIRSWGGEVRYDPGLPGGNPERLGAVERGEVDAVFDEASNQWTDQALDLGMRILPIDGPVLRTLEGLGFRRGTLAKALFPGLEADVQTLDFSGFMVYTHADVPDDVVRSVCAALEARKDRIHPDKGDPPLRLDLMCKDTPEGPIGIPLHPAAERFWGEQGYI